MLGSEETPIPELVRFLIQRKRGIHTSPGVCHRLACESGFEMEIAS